MPLVTAASAVSQLMTQQRLAADGARTLYRSHGIIWALFPGSSNAEKNAAGSTTGLHLFVENAVSGAAQARTAVRYLYCGRYNLATIHRSDEETGRTEGTEDQAESSRLLPKEWKNMTEQVSKLHHSSVTHHQQLLTASHLRSSERRMQMRSRRYFTSPPRTRWLASSRRATSTYRYD